MRRNMYIISISAVFAVPSLAWASRKADDNPEVDQLIAFGCESARA